VAVAGQYLKFETGKLERGCLVAVQRPGPGDGMDPRYDDCEGPVLDDRTGIDR
jgi:hypothetical protein